MLRSTFTNASATPTLPSAAQLKGDVVSGAGTLIYNNSNLSVEIRQFSNLSSGSVAITDGTVDYGTPGASDTPGSTLALRAQSSVVIFVPGFSALTKVESTALVRRQSY